MTNVERILAGLMAVPELTDAQKLIMPHVPDKELSAAEIIELFGEWEKAVSTRLDADRWGGSFVGRLWHLQPMSLPGVVIGL
jgi:hypothetical protein